MKNPKYQIFKSQKNDEYYYHLRARNGEIILSSEGYKRKRSCKKGIASVKANATDISRYEFKSGRSLTFNLKARNGRIIGRSESYTTEAARDKGMAAVMRDGLGAPIEGFGSR